MLRFIIKYNTSEKDTVHYTMDLEVPMLEATLVSRDAEDAQYQLVDVEVLPTPSDTGWQEAKIAALTEALQEFSTRYHCGCGRSSCNDCHRDSLADDAMKGPLREYPYV